MAEDATPQYEISLDKLHDPRVDKINRTQLLSEHATLSFLLTGLYNRVFRTNLKVEHSLGDGLYCYDVSGLEITQEMVDKLTAELNAALESDSPIEIVSHKKSNLLQIFSEKKLTDKLGVLKAWQDSVIPCIQYEDVIDYILEPMATEKERLKIFEIRKYGSGLVLRFATMLSPLAINEWKDQDVLHDMFLESESWVKLLNVDCVASLNRAIYDDTIDEIRRVAEGLHERKIAKIAEQLTANFPTKRVITIAGPSSSNKTTFAKRLGIQLRVSGYRTTIIEMDDYFTDLRDIPVGPDGLQDFEHISAMNVPLLAERVHQLLNGEAIPRRKYDFKKGEGVDSKTQFLQLPANSFLIMEGIHGLNPQLLQHIGQSEVTPIYVSALTPLNIDLNHRFPTSDLRLIRRIIRDKNYRGKSPRRTIERWTSVRVGEERNIFPYQANAQLFFNSSLVYELPVLSVYARALLSEATFPDPDEDIHDPKTDEITEEARRLLKLIGNFYPLNPEKVPRTSCIREFIGGSELKY